MNRLWANNSVWQKITGYTARSLLVAFSIACFVLGIAPAFATSFTETVPNGNGPIPATYPPVGGTMFVFIGANGNVYYQFVNPSTQFEGFQYTGNPSAFRGNPFQLGPSQTLNCGPTDCEDYFGGSIVEGYARLTARDGDACPGNFDFNDVFFEVNGFRIGSFSGPEQVERTNRTGTTSLGFENCFRNQGSNETSTGWFDLTPIPGFLDNVLAVGSTTPFVFDNDGSTNRGDNFWFFRDGNDATGTPEVAPGVFIVKTSTQSNYSAVDDIIDYQFLVTNIGSVTLTNIVVTDTFIAGAVSCPQATLLSGASMQCTGSHTVTQQNIDDDIVFKNVASVTATPTEGTLGAISGELEIPGPSANNLMTITKVPSINSGADVGNTITYTYEVRNMGNITLNNVNVTDAHNGVGTLSSITPTNITLAPGIAQEFEATYVVQQGDVDAQTDITNTATAEAVPARGTIIEPSAIAAVSVVTENRVLTLNKETSTADFSNVGDIINYTYLVTNNGNVSITSQLVITDDVISAAGGNVSCPAIPVGGLLPTNSLTCTATYSVTQDDLNTGTVTNIATASDGIATSNQDTVTVTGTQTPDLTLDKRLTAASPTSYDTVGNQLFYEYEVSNTGNVTITSEINVSDDRISSVTCPPLTGGILNPGSSIICTGIHMVDQDDIDIGNVTNIADATDGTTTSASDTVVVNATQLPALSLTKTADEIQPGDFQVGVVANYTYIVTNSGNTTIEDAITIADSRISSVTCDPLPTGGLLPLGTIECQGSYVVDGNDVALFEVTNLATATDGNVTSPQVSETVPLTGVPSLSLTKTAAPGSTFAAVGDTITYSFEVTNDGNVSFATPITITDNTIPGSPIACYTPSPANPDLISGESVTCTGTFIYSVDQDDLDAGVVVNEATANTTFMGTTPVVSAPATVTVTANSTPSIVINKSALPNSFAAVGEVIAYTLAANNNGNQTLTNVTISDPLIPSLMCTIPTLAPGATDNSCVGNYTVDQDDIDLGRIDNVASASATSPQGTKINGSGSLTINGPAPAPAVEVTKAASPSPFGPEGSLINYTFAVRNAGNVRLNNIEVTDPIDGGFLCNIAALNPGITDATTCSLNYTVQQGDINSGSITNEATVTAISADPSGQSVNNTDEIITPGPARNPAIEIEKLADVSGLSSPAQVNDIISYTFRIENTGNVTLTNIGVSDPDAVVLGAAIASLDPGDVDTGTFTATRTLTQDDINAGSFSNQATASADTPVGLPSINQPSDDPTTPAGGDPTTVQLPAAPSISLTKVGMLNDGGDGRPDVGDTIDYTFTVENTGNVTLTNITMTDPLVSVTGGPLASLLPTITDISTFEATYILTQADINRGEVLNQAVVTANTPAGGTVIDNSDDPAVTPGENDPTSTPLAIEASIVLEKVATLIDGGDGVDENDTIEYAFTVTNTGNVPLSNITITDALVAVNGGPITLQPGLTDNTTFTAVYTIQQTDINSGSFTNTATVNATDPNGNGVSDISDDPADATGNDDPTTVVFPQTPAITVEKVANTSGFSSPPIEGDIITYTFRVENTGNVTLTNVLVTDPSATVLGSEITLLPGGVDTGTFTASYTLQQVDINTGSFTNQATVTANPPSGSPITNLSDDPSDPNGLNDPTLTPIQQNPELTTVKSAVLPVAFANVGDLVTYEYIVTNSGNTTITSPITITDNLITDPTRVSCPALPAGGLLPTAPNNTLTCIGTYDVTQADLDRGTVTNLASASDGTTTSPTVSETIPDGVPAALTIVKSTTNPPFVAVGEVVTYSYLMTNNGGRTLTGTTEVIDNRIATPINCFTGNFIAGTSQSCTATYTITQVDLDAGFVTNEAFAQNDNVTAVGLVTSPTDSVTLNAAQTPAITIEKVGNTVGFSTPPQVGDEITYSFTVTNTGNVTLTNVIVSDPTAVVSGTPIASLAPFDPTATVQTNVDTVTYTASRLITQDDIDAGQFTNQASVRATPPSGSEINITSDDPSVTPGANDPTVVSINQTPSIEIEKTAVLDDFGDGIVDIGDEILYTFNVINTGNVTLTNITISDLDATITGGPISLAPGVNNNTTFTGVHVLDQDDINAGTFSNQATVSATPSGGGTPITEPSDDPSTGTDDDPTAISIPASPSIVITKVATINAGIDGSVDEGDTISYAFRVENTGNVTLTNITVTDPSADVSGGTLASLAPDTVDETTFTAVHVLTQTEIDSGEYSNQATVQGTPFGGGTPVIALSDDPFDTTSNNDPTVTTLSRSPALTTTKASGAQSALAADGTFTQVFSIEVENTGNATITNPTLVDNLESVFGAAFDPSSSATSTSGVTVAPFVTAGAGNTGTAPVANAAFDGDAASGLLSGSSGSLAPGDIITVTFTALFDSTQLSGTLVNSATASGIPPTGTTIDTTDATGTSDVVGPVDVGELGLVKTSVIDLTGGVSSTVLDAGDTINYTYSVTNMSSTLNALNVVVSEAGGASFTGTNGAPTPVASNDGTTIDATGVTNDLAPNATLTWTASYTLSQEDIDAGQVDNSATVAGVDPFGNDLTDTSDEASNGSGTGNDDPTVTTLSRSPALTTTKASGAQSALAADGTFTQVFSIEVENTGNATITNPTLVDNLESVFGAAFDPSSSATSTSGVTVAPFVTAGAGNTGTAPVANAAFDGDAASGLLSGSSGSLAPGDIITVTFTALFDSTQLSGTLVNSATASGIPPTGTTIDTTDATGTSDVVGPVDVGELGLVKTSVIDLTGGVSSTVLDAGDTINYTYSVTNMSSTLNALNVVVSEAGGASFTGTNGAPTPVASNDGTTIDATGVTNDLAPNATLTWTASYTLSQEDIDAGQVDNSATVAGVDPFGNDLTDTSDEASNGSGTGNDDPTVTTLSRSPALTTTKASGAQSALAADGTFTQVFSIEVENTGNATITNPTLVDNLESVFGAAFDPSSSATSTSGVTVAPFVTAGAGNTGTAPVANAAFDGDAASGLLSGSSGSLAPGDIITVTFTALFDSTQLSGTLVNSATASGIPPTGTTIDTTDATGTSDVVGPVDVGELGLVKTSVIDLTGGVSSTVLDAGDTINYTYSVTNMSSTLNALNVVVSEAGGASFTGTNGAPTPVASNDGTTIDATGVTNDLAPNATLTWTASYTLSQEDIDAGQVDNSATVAGVDPFGNDLTDTSDEASNGSGTGNDDPTVTMLVGTPSVDIEKSLTSVTQVFPFIYDVVYEINVENTGNVTLPNFQIEDDLSVALSPGTVISTDITLSDFIATGIENTAYDGVGVTQLLVSGVELEPLGTGTIVVTARVDFSSGFPSQGNTATASSDLIPVPVSSNDPSITPGDSTDTNPTPSPIDDADNDGSPDIFESSTSDRDGDGIPDAQDYDPTGYFYCQETARILPGGLISITGPLGTQSGVGTSNNITIVRDGADGSFQFFVSAPGTYTLNATLPATGAASTDRLPSGTLDATSLLPANPAVLGAGEVGGSGTLSDGTQAANPFYFTFDIAAGDPSIFNNNIPLIFCGVPELTASKVVTGTPSIQSNGNTQFTFLMAAENTGTTQVNDVSLVDDLNAVFGAGNYTVVNNRISSAPATFTASSNAGFNGASDNELLQSGGTLLVGERVEVELVVEIMATASGTFTNTVIAGGASPLDGSPIDTNSASTSIDVVAPGDVDQLQVEKIAGRSLVRIGEVLPYSITITNPVALPRIGVNIVDFLPAGLVYRPGSAQIDGVAYEPVVAGRRLTFGGQDIAANSSITVTFNVGVSAAASAVEFENQAWVEDPLSGNRISNIGTATVRREIEHVFDCGEIIGKVFDDKNRNGYQDKGEPGLPGVRVATVKGLLITTDKHGRYHVPCASIPDADIGSNFIIKLDTRTLPTGYRITTENPRVVRLTRGKLTKLNFGASISRVVRIDLNSQAFVNGSIEPSKALTNAFGKMVKKLSQEPSVLKLSYQSSGNDTKLAKQRMRNIAKIIKKRWRRSGGNYDLEIETRVVKK